MGKQLVFHNFITHTVFLNLLAAKETERCIKNTVQQSGILGSSFKHFGDWESHRVGGGGHVTQRLIKQDNTQS